MAKGKFARWLILGHRWLGIACSLLMLFWFISGLIMLYVDRPQLDEARKLALLPTLHTAAVQVSPAAAWRSLGLEEALPNESAPNKQRPSDNSSAAKTAAETLQAIHLSAVGVEPNQPAYRLLAAKRWWTVDAQTLALRPLLDEAQALQLLHNLALSSGDAQLQQIERISQVDIDQWTVYRSFDAGRPYWKAELHDGRHYYVSAAAHEVALITSRAERAWNWLGSVTHWIYFTPLRQHGKLWSQVIVWSSFLAFVVVISGLWLGWQRLRLRSPYRRTQGNSSSPYQNIWKRWHHWLGLISGLILISWLVSGWLSMGPFGLGNLGSNGPRPVLKTALPIDQLDTLPQFAAGTKEIEWTTLGKSLLQRNKSERNMQLVLAGEPLTGALSLETINAAFGQLPGIHIKEAAWLNAADTRYYPLRHRPRSFPVARLQLDDARQSLVYVTPKDGQLALVSSQKNFVSRWLYHGLHSFDFPFLVHHPWLRDLVVISLSLLGIIFCLTSCQLAWQRTVPQRSRRIESGRRRAH